MQEALVRTAGIQTPQGIGGAAGLAALSASAPPTALPKALLTESAFRALLGDVSPRKFAELLAAGVINAPLELGPRMPRWTVDDFNDAVARLQRRSPQAEPQTLAEGRRARIEAMKGGKASSAS